MKICHITTAHRPFDVRIFLKECLTLSRAGYETFLIARIPERQRVQGVTIIPPPVRHGRLGRIISALFDVRRVALDTGAEIFHFHDPELVITGMMLKMSGKKVIYDSHEDYPAAAMSRDWISVPLRRPIAFSFRMLERAACLFFDAVVAATPAIAENMPCSKTVTVQNFPLQNEFYSPTPREVRVGTEQYVTYVGPCVEERAIVEMVLAMGLLPQRLPTRLKLAGEIAPKTVDYLSTLKGWERVDLMGYLDRPSVGRLLSGATAGLVLFHPAPNHVRSQPNKLFEYFSAGLPVIGSHFPLWKQLIEENGCGLCVDPQDPRSIADAVQELAEAGPERLRKISGNCRTAVETKFNWEAESSKLTALYRKLESSNEGK